MQFWHDTPRISGGFSLVNPQRSHLPEVNCREHLVRCCMSRRRRMLCLRRCLIDVAHIMPRGAAGTVASGKQSSAWPFGTAEISVRAVVEIEDYEFV